MACFGELVKHSRALGNEERTIKNLLFLLLPLLALASCSQPPETSSGDPRVDCAKVKSAAAMKKRARESREYYWRKYKPIIQKYSFEKSAESEEHRLWDENRTAHKVQDARKNFAVYAVTKHLGYSQKEPTRMWEYREGGKLYEKYFELPDDEKEGDIPWLIDQGLPHTEVSEFCKALGINPWY